MLRIDATMDGTEYTYRTNDSGECLFTGVAENRQINCDSGFRSLRKIKTAIREDLKDRWKHVLHRDDPMPRIQYRVHPDENWKD